MRRDPGQRPPCVVVIGVSGVGKTTVARLLAQRLGVPFAEADDFHSPESVAKMSAGMPLTDADRGAWLEAIGRWLRERDRAATGGVVPCSALRRRYRDVLRAACPDAFFVHLTARHEEVGRRMSERSGHFMPRALLESQEAALEPLEADERGGAVDAGPAPGAVVESVLDLMAETENGANGPWPTTG
ncbi:gluconokinase [Streptomyces murinus]|uniref:gluconokinase n=1 Tax=Streptomyces murinus TaxID=33900 RepID=UPI002E807C01|nr:gluconokinase [Streptomyces murinus]WUD11287.1 gluconokinase [Streptomyces murinus]